MLLLSALSFCLSTCSSNHAICISIWSAQPFSFSSAAVVPLRLRRRVRVCSAVFHRARNSRVASLSSLSSVFPDVSLPCSRVSGPRSLGVRSSPPLVFARHRLRLLRRRVHHAAAAVCLPPSLLQLPSRVRVCVHREFERSAWSSCMFIPHGPPVRASPVFDCCEHRYEHSSFNRLIPPVCDRLEETM
jgi:hypothetical protein